MKEKLNKFLKSPKTKKVVTDVVNATAVLVGISLATIGAIVVTAVVMGAIQQKIDPEGFKEAWIKEMKDDLAEAEES